MVSQGFGCGNLLKLLKLSGFALEGSLAGWSVAGFCGGARGVLSGLCGVFEASGFFAECLETGRFRAESADLLSVRFGDEVAHVGILSGDGLLDKGLEAGDGSEDFAGEGLFDKR